MHCNSTFVSHDFPETPVTKNVYDELQFNKICKLYMFVLSECLWKHFVESKIHSYTENC